ARLPGLVDESLETAEAGLRGPRRAAVVAEHVEHPPHLPHRVAPRVTHPLHRMCGLLGARGHRLRRTICHDDHRAEAVRDDVMDLAGDPRTFLGSGDRLPRVTLPRELLGAALQGDHMFTPRLGQQAEWG